MWVCMLSGTGTLSFSSRYVSDLVAYQCNGDGKCPNFPYCPSVGFVLVVRQFLPGVPILSDGRLGCSLM